MKSLLKSPLHPVVASWAVALLMLQGCSSGDDEHAGHDDEGERAGAHVENDDHEGHDEGEESHIELTERQFRSAGIEVATAQPGRVSEALTLPGTVAPNADTVVQRPLQGASS